MREFKLINKIEPDQFKNLTNKDLFIVTTDSFKIGTAFKKQTGIYHIETATGDVFKIVKHNSNGMYLECTLSELIKPHYQMYPSRKHLASQKNIYVIEFQYTILEKLIKMVKR